jgi:exonuclease SbcD
VTRIVAVADLHIGATHLTTLDEQQEALEQLHNLVIAEKPDVLLIAGDLFHYNRPSPDALKVAGRFFARLTQVPIVMAKGNHDPDASEVALYFRGKIDVPSEPSLITHAGIHIGVLPYLPDRFVRASVSGNATKEDIARELTLAVRTILQGFLARRRPGIPMVLVAHGTVAGTETSSGWSMGWVGGTDWRILVEEAAQFDLAIVGHIHRHQAPAPNVVVPGSLLPLDFSETDPHGIIVADVEGSVATVTCAPPSWRFAEIAGPMVATLEWDDRELVRVMTGPLIFDGTGARRAPEKLRVRIRCNEENARRFPTPAVVAQLQRAGAKQVQVDLEITRGQRARDEAVTAEVTPLAALRRHLEFEAYQRDEPASVEVLDRGQEVIESLEHRAGVVSAGDLELRTIEAHDFLGIHDATINFDGQGVYAITGPVGAGKSSLGCDVPRFALFGASRYGAKVSDQLVRQGADLASAAVEMQSAMGDRYRVVRKVKRTARGATSTLDVLASAGDAANRNDWRPLSSGKVADGQTVIDRILGGLTDETLVASSLVVQRAADAFTRARPEDRKRLLAEAAGLGIYDELTEVTRDRLASADRGLALLHAKAEPLRTRVALIPEVTTQIDAAMQAVARLAVAVQTAEHRRDEADEELRKTRERAADYERYLSEAAELHRRIDAIDAEVADWTRKHTAATEILRERGRLAKARTDLDKVRGEIVLLEAQLVAELAADGEHHRAAARKASFEQRLSAARQLRQQESRGLDHLIDEAKRRGHLIEEAECCRPEPSCVFLVDAREALAGIPALEEKVAQHAEPSADETALINELLAIVIPDAADFGITKGKLTKARSRAVELERDAQVAEKIARAEEVIAQHGEATDKLRVQREELSTQKAQRDGALIRFGGKPNVPSATGTKVAADSALKQAQREEQQAIAQAAELRGRLASLTDARAELGPVEKEIAAGAVDLAAWKELAVAWKACRVMVLETSVIPAVEVTANEILRRFPYGMQLTFSTQRAKRDGDGVSEALDIEILGGRAPVYEGCSGGQRTTIDFALHVAIALVVSRRSATRLRFLFADEPEGLDEPGRAAFAALARWIHQTYGLTVLVASHAADLVNALGGQRIDVVPGADGSTVEVAA